MSKEGSSSNKWFWNRYARLYDFEINRFSGKAYQEMYQLMANVLSSDMRVLEVATGTGLIATNIAPYVHHIEATDFSPKMIETAKKKKAPANIRFSVEDATELSFEDEIFDTVIISNALHIMPDPVKVLKNISRVLKPKGLLIAPTYSHGHIHNSTWNLNTKILKLIGLKTYSKWTPNEYVSFVCQNGFSLERWQILHAAFLLVYLEARKTADFCFKLPHKQGLLV
jgi:ubiquinone/menaquinone biosynthesis C-methylase UbiE